MSKIFTKKIQINNKTKWRTEKCKTKTILSKKQNHLHQRKYEKTEISTMNA